MFNFALDQIKLEYTPAEQISLMLTGTLSLTGYVPDVIHTQNIFALMQSGSLTIDSFNFGGVTVTELTFGEPVITFKAKNRVLTYLAKDRQLTFKPKNRVLTYE